VASFKPWPHYPRKKIPRDPLTQEARCDPDPMWALSRPCHSAVTTATELCSEHSSSSSDTELPLVVENFDLLNDVFPFPSILDAGYPIFNLHLANVLFDVVLPSVLGSSL